VVAGGPPASGEVTVLLRAWSDGDEASLEQLLPIVEAELRRLARIYMAKERRGHTLQTTALVNEAFVRLVDAKGFRWQDRSFPGYLGAADAPGSGGSRASAGLPEAGRRRAARDAHRCAARGAGVVSITCAPLGLAALRLIACLHIVSQQPDLRHHPAT